MTRKTAIVVLLGFAALAAIVSIVVMRPRELPPPVKPIAAPPIVEPTTAQEPAAPIVQEEPASIESKTPAVEPPSEQGASISGRVTDTNLNPIEGATVSAYAGRGDAVEDDTRVRFMFWGAQGNRADPDALGNVPEGVKSDTEGSYRLLGVTPGATYSVTARARGYAQAIVRTLTVPVKADLTNVDLVLEQGAIVSGHVVDTRERRVASAVVGLMPLHLPLPVEGASRAFVAYVTARADKAGEFEIDAVYPGAYRFRIRIDAPQRGSFLRPEPDTISLQAGDIVTGIELVIESPGERIIEGCARDEDDVGITGVDVVASYYGGTPGWAASTTDKSGHYRLEGVMGESARVVFTHESYALAKLHNVHVGTIDADVVMVRNGGISGIVLDSGTRKPVQEFRIEAVTVEPPIHEFRIGAVTVESPHLDGTVQRFFSGEHPELPAGDFIIEKVVPGTVTLLCRGDPCYISEQVTGIRVESGKLTTGVTVYLSRPCIIQGYVTRRGRPVTEGGTVTAFAVSDPERQRNSSGVDPSGFYCMMDMPPDTYTVVVEAPGADGTRGSVDSRTVQVGAGQVVRVDFDLGGTAAIRGVVSPIEGYNFSGVLVRKGHATEPFSFETWGLLRSQALGWSLCDSEGNYKIGDLPPGAHAVTAVWAPQAGSPAADIRQVSRSITLKDGDELEVNFDR